MPDHRIAYQKMVSGERGLPPWMATPAGLMGSATMSGSEVKEIDDLNREVFYACKSHQCDTTSLVVIFDETTSARGVLFAGETVRFLGHPNAAEKKALLAEDHR